MAQTEHHQTCERGDACVECGGCACGLIPSTCDGPGCYSHDAHDEWWDEQGHDCDGCSYGCH